MLLINEFYSFQSFTLEIRISLSKIVSRESINIGMSHERGEFNISLIDRTHND